MSKMMVCKGLGDCTHGKCIWRKSHEYDEGCDVSCFSGQCCVEVEPEAEMWICERAEFCKEHGNPSSKHCRPHNKDCDCDRENSFCVTIDGDIHCIPYVPPAPEPVPAPQPSVTVELHCGSWALMINGHGIVIEGDLCRSDQFAGRIWTSDMLREVAAGSDAPAPSVGELMREIESLKVVNWVTVQTLPDLPERFKATAVMHIAPGRKPSALAIGVTTRDALLMVLRQVKRNHCHACGQPMPSPEEEGNGE